MIKSMARLWPWLIWPKKNCNHLDPHTIPWPVSTYISCLTFFTDWLTRTKLGSARLYHREGISCTWLLLGNEWLCRDSMDWMPRLNPYCKTFTYHGNMFNECHIENVSFDTTMVVDKLELVSARFDVFLVCLPHKLHVILELSFPIYEEV